MHFESDLCRGMPGESQESQCRHLMAGNRISSNSSPSLVQTAALDGDEIMS
jgi:hypothetical protein